MEESKTVGQLNAWEKNPRYITKTSQRVLKKTLEKFGDLSGIVFNIRKGALVTAHQRVSWFGESTPVTIVTRFDPPTDVGTVADGFVEHEGERFTFRQVDWDDETHAAAAIAANKQAGDWDDEKLRSLIKNELGSLPDVEVTGMDSVTFENFFGRAETPAANTAPTGAPPMAQSQLTPTDQPGEYSDLRQVILVYDLEAFESFNSLAARLCEDFNVENKAEAVLGFLRERYAV